MSTKFNLFTTPTPEKFGNTFFADKEFMHQGYPFPPGYYFWDVDEDPFGPFLSPEQRDVAKRLYLTKLMKGEITPLKRTILKPRAGESWH